MDGFCRLLHLPLDRAESRWGEKCRGWTRCSPGAGHADLPHADQVVAVSGEQGLAIAGPGQGGALRGLSTSGPSHLGPQVLHLVLALEVPDLDGGAAGGAQPVPGGGQDYYCMSSHIRRVDEDGLDM